jgi:hypothetical protein
LTDSITMSAYVNDTFSKDVHGYPAVDAVKD